MQAACTAHAACCDAANEVRPFPVSHVSVAGIIRGQIQRIAELEADLKKSEDSQREYFELNEELEDDLKLQRQANKFNHDEHQQEKAELERQLAAINEVCDECKVEIKEKKCLKTGL
jgi:septal ring factor EnvC (AmiA/AmiB activator)